MPTRLEKFKDELTKDHWMWSYSWRGVRLDQLEKRYKLPRADILSVMREIAHAHDPPGNQSIKALPRCRSCGMRIVWGKSLEKEKAIPLDPKILHIITAAGEYISGRESHFVSCPNAERHRK